MGWFTEGAKAVGKFLVQDVVGRPVGAAVGGVMGAITAPFIGFYKDAKNIIESDSKGITKFLGLLGVMVTSPLQLTKALDGFIEGAGSGLADGFKQGVTTPERMASKSDGGKGLFGSVVGAGLGGILGAATGGIITAWQWINSDKVGWTGTGPNGQPVLNLFGILAAGVAGLVFGTIGGIAHGIAYGFMDGFSGAIMSPANYAKYGLEAEPIESSQAFDTNPLKQKQGDVNEQIAQQTQNNSNKPQPNPAQNYPGFQRNPAQPRDSYHSAIAANHNPPAPPANSHAAPVLRR